MSTTHQTVAISDGRYHPIAVHDKNLSFGQFRKNDPPPPPDLSISYDLGEKPIDSQETSHYIYSYTA